MRAIILYCIILAWFTSCNNAKTSNSICDTLCKTDSIKFKGNDQFNQSLAISLKDCKPDTLKWTHGKLKITRQIQLTDFLSQDVKLNPSAVSASFQDTTCAWLAFNDCVTSRGYILKLPFNKSNGIQKISGALNKFDSKFFVADGLLAYTDRGSIYVVDGNTGKEVMMTFKEEYPIDFMDIHKVLDSINVSRSRIYVKLIKDGQEVPIEKQIAL
ncbi:MAG TPA: hypothetical protein VFQ58_02095 [Flavisolibacter sp.]|jgi:hypothetical protein|nr:hypothetical protein [Flavisolibacter sp.]